MSLFALPLVFALSTQQPVAITTTCNPIPSRAPADSLYALGEWKKAGEAYRPVCQCLSTKQKLSCDLQALRAFTNDPATAIQAFATLDSLVIRIEPEQASYSEALLLHSSLLLRAERIPDALKSWRLSQQTATSSLLPELQEMCRQIRAKVLDGSLDSNCQSTTSRPIQVKSSSSQASSTSVLSSMVTASSASQSSSSSQAKQRWVVQMGAFSKQENAIAQQKTLKALQIEVRILERTRNGKTLWLVVTDGFNSRGQAEAFAAEKIQPHKLDHQLLQLPQ